MSFKEFSVSASSVNHVVIVGLLPPVFVYQVSTCNPKPYTVWEYSTDYSIWDEDENAKPESTIALLPAVAVNAEQRRVALRAEKYAAAKALAASARSAKATQAKSVDDGAEAIAKADKTLAKQERKSCSSWAKIRRDNNKAAFTLSAVVTMIASTRMGTAKAGGVGFTAQTTFTSKGETMFNQSRHSRRINQALARNKRVRRQRRNGRRYIKPLSQAKRLAHRTAIKAKYERYNKRIDLANIERGLRQVAYGVVTRTTKALCATTVASPFTKAERRAIAARNVQRPLTLADKRVIALQRDVERPMPKGFTKTLTAMDIRRRYAHDGSWLRSQDEAAARRALNRQFTTVYERGLSKPEPQVEVVAPAIAAAEAQAAQFLSNAKATYAPMQDMEMSLENQSENKGDKSQVFISMFNAGVSVETISAGAGCATQEVVDCLYEAYKAGKLPADVKPSEAAMAKVGALIKQGITSWEGISQAVGKTDGGAQLTARTAAHALGAELSVSSRTNPQQPKGESMVTTTKATASYAMIVNTLVAAGAVPCAEITTSKEVADTDVVVVHSLGRPDGQVANNNNPAYGTDVLNYYVESFTAPEPVVLNGVNGPATRFAGQWNAKRLAEKEEDTFTDSEISFSASRMRPIHANNEFDRVIGTVGTYCESFYYMQDLVALVGAKDHRYKPTNGDQHVDINLSIKVDGQATHQFATKGDRGIDTTAANIRKAIRYAIFNGVETMKTKYWAYADDLEANDITIRTFCPVNNIFAGPGIVHEGQPTDRHQFVIVAVPEIVNDKVNCLYLDSAKGAEFGAKGQFRVYATRVMIFHLPEDVAADVIKCVPDNGTYTINDTSCYWPLFPNKTEHVTINHRVFRKLLSRNMKKCNAYFAEKQKTPVLKSQADKQSEVKQPVVEPKPVITPAPKAKEVTPSNSEVAKNKVNHLVDLSHLDTLAASIQKELLAYHKAASEKISTACPSAKPFTEAELKAVFSSAKEGKEIWNLMYQGAYTKEIKKHFGAAAATHLWAYILKATESDNDDTKGVPDVKAFKWNIQHLKDLLFLLHSSCMDIKVDQGGDLIEKEICLKEYEDRSELWVMGEAAFIFYNNGVVTDGDRNRAIMPTIDCWAINSKVDVSITEPFSNFMHFFTYGFIPLFANNKGKLLAGNFRENLMKMLGKTPGIVVSQDEWDAEDGGAAHVLRSSYAANVKTQITPFNSLGMWVNCAAGASDLAWNYKHKGESLAKGDNGQDMEEIDVFYNAIPIVLTRYGLPFHHAKACWMASALGHVDVDLVRKHCPKLYKSAVRWLGDSKITQDMVVITLTIKASKGLKRVLLAMAQAAESVDGKEAGFRFVRQQKLIKGSLAKVVFAPALLGAPGMDICLGELMAAEVKKRVTAYSKADAIVDPTLGHPCNFKNSEVQDIREAEWTNEARDNGWNYLTANKTINITKNKVMLFEVFKEKLVAFDPTLAVNHEPVLTGELINIRWRLKRTIDKKYSHIVFEYTLKWKENCGKYRSIRKSQLMKVNRSFMYNEFNPTMLDAGDNVVVGCADGLKDDTLYAYLMACATTIRYNVGNKSQAYLDMLHQVVKINKFLGYTTDINNPVLVIEPVSVVCGVYRHLLRMFEATFGHKAGIWFDWKQSETQAYTVYNLYRNRVEAGDWVEISNPVTDLPELGNIQLAEGESLYVIREGNKANDANLNLQDQIDYQAQVEDLLLAAEKKGEKAVVKGFKPNKNTEDNGIDSKTNILVFILRNGELTDRYLQRTFVLCGTADMPLYNVELYERSTVKESVSNSVIRRAEITALDLVIEDEEEARKLQRQLLDDGNLHTLRVKLLAAFEENHMIHKDMGQLSVVPAGGTNIRLDDASIAVVKQALAAADIQDYDLTAHSPELFEKVAHALRKFVFHLPKNVVETNTDNDSYDCADSNEFGSDSDYSEDQAPQHKSPNLMSIWLPGLYSFSKLTSKSDSNLDFVSKIYKEVIFPLLKGGVANSVDSKLGHGIMSSFLRSNKTTTFMNGCDNVTAKRICTPCTRVGEVVILYSEEIMSLYQRAKRAGIDVDAAMNGESVYVAVHRAPLAGGYIAVLRIRRVVKEDILVNNEVVTVTKQVEKPLREYPVNNLQTEDCFYHISEYQYAMDGLLVYIDAGDFDGDGGYLTPLKGYKGGPTTLAKGLALRNSVLAHEMFSAENDAYAADHYNVKNYATKGNQTLSGIVRSINKDAIKPMSDYAVFNADAYMVQNRSVGNAYAIYMIGFALVNLARSLKAAGVPLSKDMNLLTGPNSKTLVLLIAEMYEVMLGGFSTGANDYRVIILDKIRKGESIFKLTKSNIKNVREVLMSLGCEEKCSEYAAKHGISLEQAEELVKTNSLEVAAICKLVSMFYRATKKDPALLQPSDAVENFYTDDYRWIAVATCLFEMGRGKFDGYTGYIHASGSGKKAAAHMQCAKITYNTLVTLRKDKDGPGAKLLTNSIELYSLNNLFTHLYAELILEPAQVNKISWTFDQLTTFTFAVAPTVTVKAEAVTEAEEEQDEDDQSEGGSSAPTDDKPSNDDGGNSIEVESTEADTEEVEVQESSESSNSEEPSGAESEEETQESTELVKASVQKDTLDWNNTVKEESLEVQDIDEAVAILRKLQKSKYGQFNVDDLVVLLESVKNKAEEKDGHNKADNKLVELDDQAEDNVPDSDDEDEDGGSPAVYDDSDDDDNGGASALTDEPKSLCDEDINVAVSADEFTVTEKSTQAQVEELKSPNREEPMSTTTPTIPSLTEEQKTEFVEKPVANKTVDETTKLIKQLTSTLTEEQKAVIRDIGKNFNVFLTGKGGAGKSYTVEIIRAIFDIKGWPYILVGSTGISVVNVNGHATFNSAFGIGLGFNNGKEAHEHTLNEYNEVKTLAYKGVTKELIQSLVRKAQATGTKVLIIIDEISMLDTLLLSAAGQAIKEHNSSFQWLFVGDPCQLEPVKGTLFFLDQKVYDEKQQAWVTIKAVYNSEEFVNHNLTNNIRAKNDKALDDDLDSMRYGVLQTHQLPKTIQERWDYSLTHDAPKDALHLFFNNKFVKEYNEQKADEMLKSGAKSKTYRGLVDTAHKKLGNKGDNWLYKGYSSKNATIFDPISVNLTLCVGMPVMYRGMKTRNEQGELIVNGSMGTVVTLKQNSVVIKFDHTEYNTEIKYQRFFSEQGDREKGLGHFDQLPICPAFAMTFHKCQGLTFDRPVVYHFYQLYKGEICPMTAKNAAYVALSRVTKASHINFQTKLEGFTAEEMHKMAVQSYCTNKVSVAFMRKVQAECFMRQNAIS